MESQITLLLWPCLNHLQKNIAQLITWSSLIIQSVSFTSAVFEAFAEAYLCFSVSAKKNAEVIKFLGILKKYISENKICLRKKSNVSLNKKVIFIFHTIFKLDFITQIIYCRSFTVLSSTDVCVLISYFFFSYISSKKWSIETMSLFNNAIPISEFSENLKLVDVTPVFKKKRLFRQNKL